MMYGDPIQRKNPDSGLKVDMSAKHTFTRVEIDTRGHGSDYPRGYELYVSNNGVTWGAPVAVGKNEQSVLRISFPVQNARYIKFVQSGKTWHHWYVANSSRFLRLPGGSAPVPPAASGKRESARYAWLASQPQCQIPWNDVHVRCGRFSTNGSVRAQIAKPCRETSTR